MTYHNRRYNSCFVGNGVESFLAFYWRLLDEQSWVGQPVADLPRTAQLSHQALLNYYRKWMT